MEERHKMTAFHARPETDAAIDQLLVTITLTNKEAGALYGLVMTFLDVTRFDTPTLTDIVEKLKKAQLVAVEQQVRAETAKGQKQ